LVDRVRNGTMRDVVEVYCTIISGNYCRRLKKTKKCLSWFRYQQTSNMENSKFETAVLVLGKIFQYNIKV
jgi:hypothetical protein